MRVAAPSPSSGPIVTVSSMDALFEAIEEVGGMMLKTIYANVEATILVNRIKF